VGFLAGVHGFRHMCWALGADGRGALQFFVGHVGNGGPVNIVESE